jgi:hypothetical protein
MPKNSGSVPSRIECAEIQQRVKRVLEQDQSLVANFEFIMDIEFLIQLCSQEDILDDS